MKEIQGVLGEREPSGCNILCSPFNGSEKKSNIVESEEDLRRERNNKAIAESVRKLESQIAQLKDLLN